MDLYSEFFIDQNTKDVWIVNEEFTTQIQCLPKKTYQI